MLTVIERSRRYAARCPVAISGQRGHDATFHVAAVLWNGFGLTETDTLMLLREWNCGCQPPWSEAELVHKVRSVANAQHSDARGHLAVGHHGECAGRPGPEAAGTGRRDAYPTPPPVPAKQAFCPMVLKRVAAKAASVRDVVEFIMGRSPVPVGGLSSAGFLRRLYPKGSKEKVVVFSRMQSQGQLVWPADAFDLIFDEDFPAGPDGVWFLAQPVDGEFHCNPRLGGKPSRRSEESVTSWRYAVLESDKAEADEWLRCLIQLPLRIASICESGGRSIHALVRLDAESKTDWDTKIRAIKPVLVTLGADPGALSAVRLTRLPQAMRGERLQRLLYLNPAPDGTPIIRTRSAECRMGSEGSHLTLPCRPAERAHGKNGSDGRNGE